MYIYMVFGYYFKDSLYAYFSYSVELIGSMWALTGQEEGWEFENNWLGKGAEL